MNVLVRTPVSDTWAHSAGIRASRDRSTNTASDPASFNNGEFTSDNAAFTWTNDIALTDSITTQIGAEYLRQNGESTSYDTSFSGGMDSHARAVGSGWLGVSGNHGPHQVQANVRYDRYSDTGSATSGLFAYGYRLDPAWRLTAQLSNAFRAPSFNDLYFPFFGNPDLEPERAVSGELGLQYVGPAVSLRAALYRTDTRDLIAYDPATMRAENIDEARVTGFEVGGDWRSGPWRVGANGTVQRAVDDQTGERLLRRAPWLVNLAVGYDPGQWSAGIEIAVVGPRDDLDINTFRARAIGELHAGTPGGGLADFRQRHAAGAHREPARRRLRVGERLQHRTAYRHHRNQPELLMMRILDPHAMYAAGRGVGQPGVRAERRECRDSAVGGVDLAVG